MGYRIAGHVSPKLNLTGVATESHFARCVRQLFANVRPRRIVETGTYHGTGSTMTAHVQTGNLPTRNFRDGNFMTAEEISAQAVKQHIRLKMESCFAWAHSISRRRCARCSSARRGWRCRASGCSEWHVVCPASERALPSKLDNFED